MHLCISYTNNTHNKYGNKTSNGSIPVFIRRSFTNKYTVKDKIAQA